MTLDLRHLILSTCLIGAAAWSVSAQAVDCETILDNAVQGCGIESAAELDLWDEDFGTFSLAIAAGENGNALSVTGRSFSGNFLGNLKTNCFVVEQDQLVPLGYSAALANGVAPRCRAGYQQWADEACTVGAGGSIDANSPGVFPNASFAVVNGSHTVTSGTVAMQMIVDCRGDEPFEVLIDNAFAIAPQPEPPYMPLPVPTLGGWALLLLVLSLGLLGWRGLRAHGQGTGKA